MFFVFTKPVMCSEKHFTHHNWPWQIATYPVRRVSVFVTYTTIPMINPSIRRVFSQPSVFWCFGEHLWFICCDALLLTTSAFSKKTQLWQSLISRRPSRSFNSLQTQTHIIFLTVTEMKLGQTCMNSFAPSWGTPKNEKDLCITYRLFLPFRQLCSFVAYCKNYKFIYYCIYFVLNESGWINTLYVNC